MARMASRLSKICSTAAANCTSFVDALGDLSLLNKRDTTFAVVSRAPLAKLETYKVQKDGASRGFRRMAAISTMIFT